MDGVNTTVHNMSWSDNLIVRCETGVQVIENRPIRKAKGKSNFSNGTSANYMGKTIWEHIKY